jgi:hypothetical protein
VVSQFGPSEWPSRVELNCIPRHSSQRRVEDTVECTLRLSYYGAAHPTCAHLPPWHTRLHVHFTAGPRFINVNACFFCSRILNLAQPDNRQSYPPSVSFVASCSEAYLMRIHLSHSSAGRLIIEIDSTCRDCHHAHPTEEEDWNTVISTTCTWLAKNSPVCRSFPGILPWASV